MKTTHQLPPEENEALRNQLAKGADPKRIGRKKSGRDKEKPIVIPSGAHVTRDGDTIRMVLPYPPSVNDTRRNRVVMRNGKSPLAITYPSPIAKAYRAVVAKMGERCRPLRSCVRVTAKVFRPRRSGDLGNRGKLLFDCLEGIAFENDDQIVEEHWYRGDDAANPRIELEIVSLEKVQRGFA